MTRQLKFFVGISVILGTIGFLVWTAVDQTKMYMITVPEFLSAGSSYAGTTVRVAGRVARWAPEVERLRSRAWLRAADCLPAAPRQPATAAV